MATTKLKIRNDLVKKSGGAPTVIYVQYTYQGKPKLFNTGKKIEPAYWDEKGQCVKRSYRGYTTLNDFIKKKRQEVDEIVIDAQRRKLEPTLNYVEECYERLNTSNPTNEPKDFFQLYALYIAEQEGKKAPESIRYCRYVSNLLSEFERFSRYKVTLESINLEFHDKFTSFLTAEKSMSPNTIGHIISKLKAFLGYLTERGVNTNQMFRHKKFSKPSVPVDLIALTQSELDRLVQVDLSQNARLSKVRDLFVFGCVTGLRFSDAKNLKPENIKVDSIEFLTLKTRDRLSVPLTPYAKAIVDRYQGHLPRVIGAPCMNRYLKELCQLCGINEPVQKVRYVGSLRLESKAPKYEMVCTHTARRTFVTLALERGTRPEIVMRITGHKDLKTMMKYVRLTEKVTHQEFLRPYGEGMKVVG